MEMEFGCAVAIDDCYQRWHRSNDLTPVAKNGTEVQVSSYF